MRDLKVRQVSEARGKECGGWLASLRLGFAMRGRRTVMVQNAHRGPLRVLRPYYPEGDSTENQCSRNQGSNRQLREYELDQNQKTGPCHVYVLHPPGGLVAGDLIEINVDCGANTEALVTTPSAGRVYCSNQERLPQTQTVNIQVAAGAHCEWLPQENILFNGAWANNQVTVELAENANYTAWDITCLGRPAAKEHFEQGRLDQQLQIYRNGKPLLLERSRIAGGSEQLNAPWGLQAYPVFGALVSTTVNKALLKNLREMIEELCAGRKEISCAVTALPELLVVRAMAESATELRQLFVELWRELRRAERGCEPAAPRIWFT